MSLGASCIRVALSPGLLVSRQKVFSGAVVAVVSGV